MGNVTAFTSSPSHDRPAPVAETPPHRRQPTPHGLPLWPRAWYVVARSEEIRPGDLRSGALAGLPYVLFRGEGGELAALDAHCPHMGAHLEHGRVVGDRLLCPLHHWTLSRDGGCRGSGATTRHRSRSWPVQERFGLIFLHPPVEAEVGPGTVQSPLPSPEMSEAYAWTTGRPVRLATDWHSMMVNGFDILHLRSVHHRTLVEEPELVRNEGTLRLRYVSRVARGGGLSDWVMKKVSGDRIRVHQCCYGPTIVVESDLGRTRTAAVLGLLTEGKTVRAFGAFGVQKKGASALRNLLVPLHLLVARWLFTAFLKKDFAVVEGMRLTLDGVEDPGVRAVGAFLGSLPEI